MNDELNECRAEDSRTLVAPSVCFSEAATAAQPPARRRKNSAKQPGERRPFAHPAAMSPASLLDGRVRESVGRFEVGQFVGTAANWLRCGWRWLQVRRKWQLSSKRLLLCESVSLGEKRFLAIVKVDDRQFLVGGAAGNVSMLAKLDGKPEFAALLKQRPRKATT